MNIWQFVWAGWTAKFVSLLVEAGAGRELSGFRKKNKRVCNVAESMGQVPLRSAQSSPT